jgi:hypothetical protein
LGKGIYPYEGFKAELDLLKAGGLPEADVIDALIDRGEVVPAEQTVGGVDIRVVWVRPSKHFYLLVGRFALWVIPLTSADYEKERRRKHSRRPPPAPPSLDDRGPVTSPAIWFAESGAETFVDVYNTEVPGMERFAEDTIRVD